MEIKGKVALVTGGANGIGFAHVQELLRNDARGVAILDLVNSNGNDSVAKLVAEFGKNRAIFIPCDVSKPDELEAAFEKTIKEFNGLDIIINNAGIMDDIRWELQINININAVIKGTLLGLDYFGKHKGGKGGAIINMASIAGLWPFKGFPIYSATKHAVVALSRAISEHYDVTGVRIMTLCPGSTDTVLISGATEKLFEIGKEESVKGLSAYPQQSVDNVASAMIQMIETGENGSVWVSEDGKPAYQVSFALYQNLKIEA